MRGTGIVAIILLLCFAGCEEGHRGHKVSTTTIVGVVTIDTVVYWEDNFTEGNFFVDDTFVGEQGWGNVSSVRFVTRRGENGEWKLITILFNEKVGTLTLQRRYELDAPQLNVELKNLWASRYSSMMAASQEKKWGRVKTTALF